MPPLSVKTERRGSIWIVQIDRPERRNAVDRSTALALDAAFETFENDPALAVAILTGTGGTFCAGADLKAISEENWNPLQADGVASMGPSRRVLSKPLLAAIEGYAVAGGLELALMADLRIIAEDAVLGVFCRRFGVPLIDGGTVRLPQIIGLSRALDLILTGRPVDAHEALSMGLVNRVVPPGTALEAALVLAKQLVALPQAAMRNDRLSTYQQAGLRFDEAMANEFRLGLQTIDSGQTLTGAKRFADGEGRGGSTL